MRIIAELPLPTDLGTLRKFIDKATFLAHADMRAVVSYYDGDIHVCASAELE